MANTGSTQFFEDLQNGSKQKFVAFMVYDLAI